MAKGTVFLISGFELNQTASDGQYAGLRSAIKTKGYRVIAVDINWKHHTMSRFVEEFKSIYRRKAGNVNIIIGNSFGAMVAMITARELKPDKIVLCSLSPFFAEDIPRFKPGKVEKWFGQRRVKDFATISVTALTRQINQANIPSILFYGEHEKSIYKKLVGRVKNTASELKHSKLIEIPNAPHSFKDYQYISAIVAEL